MSCRHCPLEQCGRCDCTLPIPFINTAKLPCLVCRQPANLVEQPHGFPVTQCANGHTNTVVPAVMEYLLEQVANSDQMGCAPAEVPRWFD